VKTKIIRNYKLSLIETKEEAILVSRSTNWFIEESWFELYTSQDYKLITLEINDEKYAVVLNDKNQIVEIVDTEDFHLYNDLLNVFAIELLNESNILGE